MIELFDRKWFVTVVVSWVVILVLDELALYYWKKVNPGHVFSLITGKPELVTPPPQEPGTSYPNGYRPAGAG